MRIWKIVANNRKRTFVIHVKDRVLEFPYALAKPAPGADDRLREVFVDEELGRAGFTWKLASGREGSLHLDSVLEFNRDPAYMADLLIYDLTNRAIGLVEDSPLSRREIIRRLRTSASQFYRLLDPTNRTKSLRQLLSLIHLLGYDATVELKAR